VYMAVRHPDIGETVGDYKVVAELGAGGLGVVYKVERGGRFFALKLLLGPMDGRTKREIGILVHLENPGVVRYVGSDFWPHPAIGHPYIVMEYVPGDTLEAFALKHNPSARKCVRIILDVARTLEEVHGAGVFHRDLKPTNILIRETSERPVLIDFGIASLGGAACLTETRLPPATEEFRAPEPLRFRRENMDNTAQYEYTTTDELWALGVTFYWLLTDAYPFGERTDEGGMDGLRERILTRRPIAPHLVNPRVPLAASLLCMKMLAEWPGERYANVPELCSALQEALTQAESDPTWDVALVDPHAPQVTTTLEDPELSEPNEILRAFRKHGKQRPRRGLVRPNEAPVPPLVPAQVEQPRPPVQQEQSRIPLADISLAPSSPGEDRKPAASATVPPVREQLALDVAARPPRAPWRLGLAAALATVSVVGLSVSAGLWGLGASSPTSKEQPEAVRPSASPRHGSTGGSMAGHEVAPASKPLESSPGEGAVPVGAQPPAPTANAMLRTPAQTKKNETQTQRAGLRLPVKPAVAAAAACSLLDGGCTASTPQVRTEPPAVTCPQGWRETHERFSVGYRGMATVKGYKGEPGEMARVKDGPAPLQVGVVPGMGGVGALPDHTLLFGTWQLGDDRLFGTFTEAQIPGVGTRPVCLVVRLQGYTSYMDEHGKEYVCSPGLGTCLAPGSKPGNAKIGTRVLLFQPTQQP
jgi:serine/threonine protein kinase